LKFAEERARPFHDLLARVRHDNPQFIADLGCGPGNLTRLLAERWPSVRVIGVDQSAEMLAKAGALAMPPRLEFGLGAFDNNDGTFTVLMNHEFAVAHPRSPRTRAWHARTTPPSGRLASGRSSPNG
jgi:trans-aconitate methyltransferase